MKTLLLSIILLLPLRLLANSNLDSLKEQGLAQKSKVKPKKNFDVTEWKRIFNKSFGSILGSVGPNNDIGNYASLDPADGVFKFKGIIPLGKEEKSISYLSISLQGGIASNDFNKLFDGFKIGTNSSIQAEYHFKRKIKSTSIIRESEIEVVYNRQRDLINTKADLDLAHVTESYKKNLDKLHLLENSLVSIALDTASVNFKLDSTLNALTDIHRAIDNGSNPPNSSILKSLKSTIKKVGEYSTLKDSLKMSFIKNTIEVDSLRFTIQKWQYVKRDLENKIIEKRDSKVESLKDSYLFSRFTMDWFTIIGSVGKKDYSSFNSSLPFGDQIKEASFHTNSYGLAWSIYTKDETEKKSHLLNIGVVRKRDNNIDTLTTTEINQTRSFKNAVGDTVRTVGKKYSSYTDPIESRQLFNAYINYFYIFGKRSSAIHIFPSYLKWDKKTGIINMGIGYIISFKNLKKESPIINAELYTIHSDFFNSRNTKNSFVKRSEIGIKFSLPFNLF